MASFLRRLLGGPDPPAPPAVTAAVADLDRLTAARPALAPAAAALRDLLPVLFAPPVPSLTVALPPEAAAAKLAAGTPLLRNVTYKLDATTFRDRWLAACDTLARHQPGAAAVAAAARRDALPPDELLGHVLAGEPDAVHARADAFDLDPALTATVLRLTALPTLAAVGATRTALRSAAWPHGSCPTCGSWPLLGEYRGLEQTRVLRCGLCAAGWAFPRLRCPFCGAGDHRPLGYLHAAGEQDRYRAATCDACRGYVKMTTALAPLSAPALLVADLATLHLDLVAAERGYYVG